MPIPTAFETQGFVAGYVRSYARYLGHGSGMGLWKVLPRGQFPDRARDVGRGLVQRRPAAAEPAENSDIGRDLFADPNLPFVPRG